VGAPTAQTFPPPCVDLVVLRVMQGLLAALLVELEVPTVHNRGKDTPPAPSSRLTLLRECTRAGASLPSGMRLSYRVCFWNGHAWVVSLFRVDGLSVRHCHPQPTAEGLVLHMTGRLLTNNEILRRFAPQNDTFRTTEHADSESVPSSTQLRGTTRGLEIGVSPIAQIG
jgi:hypothetical protein